MEIVMLGHSAAGKTTYVSLMYALMHTGYGGFSLRAADQGDHQSLIGAAEWILAGRYPPASDQRAVFELVLRHDGADVFPFSWRDYRGGTLSERSDSPQAAQLHADLRSAGGIVIFCDSATLLTDRRAGRDVRTIVSHVQRALDARGDEITPLVIVLTKADLVDLDDEKVTEQLGAPFMPLIEAVARTSHIIGTLVPVACGPRPMNVAVPVLWALRFGIIGRARSLAASVDRSVAAADRAAAGDTLGNRFLSWLNDETPNWRISLRHRQEAEAERARYAPLVAPAERLGELLDGFPGF
ncbi:hypothetical protein O7623_08905 [Solwaraspora sp. WMMD791]|uniref:TRAFAC clade GTPase domain-containing protein n=1 Tax=Solwaraspora sp. WMMD791 TaxID=3016086 RepID=UPI00249C3993|nr:hypothetical protein [Solwaraspora sp. WMMD791]WFE29289.1 hypothetical protein O7623_08905 [Solwaraspora sp. WMMD791]